MSETVFKAQIKAAAYGIVALVGADRALAVLREVQAEIYKDNKTDDWSGPGSR
ncbi:hypothetical protein BAJUN_00270 [Bajunvirus bajun]|uniref:Uncharacterized protein n=1 Tax=Brevundimonas phage vB_BgoS-Bajun TaxID=2948594 RepID=A0A9E7N6U0_9CAUD|nr:hypothetical protein BAJUN_00270 [Brevundimonas phage vB_BgoS-Bajun]